MDTEDKTMVAEKPVPGISTPPSALGGFLRRAGTRYSRTSFGQWLPLIFSDRINIWDGFLHDVKKKKFADGLTSRIIKSGLKNDKGKFLAKAGVMAIVGAFVFGWMMTSARRKK